MAARRPRVVLVLVALVATLAVPLLTAAETSGAATLGGGANRSFTLRRSGSMPAGLSTAHVPAGYIANPETRGEASGGSGGAAAATTQGADRWDGPNRSHSARPSGASSSASTAASVLPPPVVGSTPVTGAGPQVVGGFEGIDAFEERYVASNGNQFTVEPPDQGLCVGNGYVMETVNDALQVFGTNGTPKTAPIGLNAFYGYPPVINRTTGRYGQFLTDPSCWFDHDVGRWFHVALTLEQDPSTGDLTGVDHLDIAVSDSSSPLGNWHFYFLAVQNDGTQGTAGHVGCPCIGDYPHIGFDASGMYITTNEYPFSDDPGIFGNNFNGADLYAASKRALASGARHVPVVEFDTLVRSDGTPGFTVSPAESAGDYATTNNGTEYFLSSSATQEAKSATGTANHIGVWSLSNTSSLDTSSPHLSLSNTTLASEVYGVPPYTQQKPGPVPLANCLSVGCLGLGPSQETEGPIDSGDSRMQQVWFVNGKIWGALTTRVVVNGNLQSGIAWFRVNSNGGSGPTMGVQGYLASGGNDLSYPAIATKRDGTGAMAFTVAGRRYFPSAGYALVSDNSVTGVHVSGAGAAPEDGFCEYQYFNCNSPNPGIRPRWGDYGAAVAWGNELTLASEWIAHACDFATFENDPTCGNTRAPLANWSTYITRLQP